MNQKPSLLLTTLCLSFVSIHSETSAEVIVPGETEAIASPLELADLRPDPSAFAFAEKGGVLLSSPTETEPKILRINATDGKAEQTIETPAPVSGIFSYDGALFLASSPDFYIVDKNGETHTFAQGFGESAAPSHFALGMDGRIYGTFGDSGFSVTNNNGKKADNPDSGAVFRFEPDGTDFEIVHRGLVNPAGLAFNEYGDLYTIDTPAGLGDKPRFIRIMEDGDSGWNKSYRDQEPSDTRWIAEKIWETRNDSQPAFALPASAHLTTSPAGLTYHPGAGFLKNETSRFFIADNSDDPAKSGITSFAIREKRLGADITDPRPIASGIRPTGIAFTSDGILATTDTLGDPTLISIDAGENTNLPEKATEAATLLSEGFDQRNSAQLAALLGHPDSRVRLRAQIALTRKKDALKAFEPILNFPNIFARIHAIRGLGIIARRGPAPIPGEAFTSLPPRYLKDDAAALLTPLLSDPNPEIRIQVLRALGEAPVVGDTLPIGAMLSDDSNRVRIAAAIAIGKLKAIGQYYAVIGLLEKNNNRNREITQAGTYALQHISQNGTQISALTAYDSPAVRLAAVVCLRRMASLEAIRFLRDEDPAVQDEAIRTVIDLKMTEGYPVLTEILDSSTREWPAPILALLESVDPSED